MSVIMTENDTSSNATGVTMRTFLATPKLCPDLTQLPRHALADLIDAAIAELDARDGDPDLEPEEDRGELDHLPDDPRHHAPNPCALENRHG